MAPDSILVYILVFIAGTLAYIVSTLSGGGGALILVPIARYYLGTGAVAPVLNLANSIGQPFRVWIFWKSIQWHITARYVPAGILGVLLGGWLFSHLRLELIEVLLGIFLVSTIFQYRFGKKERSFRMPIKWFIPLGFLIGLISTMVGAVGPVLNPFYLNHGIEKQELIATKTVNSFILGFMQIGTYVTLGSLRGELWVYGIVLGVGAAIGNLIGKKLLNRISSRLFRVLVIAVMVISGVVMIISIII